MMEEQKFFELLEQYRKAYNEENVLEELRDQLIKAILKDTPIEYVRSGKLSRLGKVIIQVGKKYRSTFHLTQSYPLLLSFLNENLYQVLHQAKANDYDTFYNWIFTILRNYLNECFEKGERSPVVNIDYETYKLLQEFQPSSSRYSDKNPPPFLGQILPTSHILSGWIKEEAMEKNAAALTKDQWEYFCAYVKRVYWVREDNASKKKAQKSGYSDKEEEIEKLSSHAELAQEFGIPSEEAARRRFRDAVKIVSREWYYLCLMNCVDVKNEPQLEKKEAGPELEQLKGFIQAPANPKKDWSIFKSDPTEALKKLELEDVKKEGVQNPKKEINFYGVKVVDQHFIQEFPYKDIAGPMDKTPKAVRQKAHRVMFIFKVYLNPKGK